MADSVSRRYRITKSEELSEDILIELPEVNTGDPQALIDFIEWKVIKYPAQNYALVLWNHGSGWKDDDIYKVVARTLNFSPKFVSHALTHYRVMIKEESTGPALKASVQNLYS